jgi:hypothetical protein
MRPEVAYYYPNQYWTTSEGGWIKSLLLFFDEVAILLPGYMYGSHSAVDPSLTEPLEDRGLLRILDPSTWVDEQATEDLVTVMVDLLTGGAFDDLENGKVQYHELSYSRMGYGADVALGGLLVEELQRLGLARPSEDGVSVPLHPVVRTTILVLLGQLARSVGDRRDLTVHPVTSSGGAIRDLVSTLAREGMPSAGNVLALDLEPVGLNLDGVPLDEVLSFRADHRESHRAYVRDLHRFLGELASIEDTNDRAELLDRRREELADAANDLRRHSRKAFQKARDTWVLGIAGSAWAVGSSDPLGFLLTAGGLVRGSLPDDPVPASAYSYVFDASRRFQ